MVAIPVRCQKCFYTGFVNNLIGGNGNINVTFINSSYGPCPRCGSDMNILSGKYRIEKGIVKAIVSASWTSTALLSRYEKVLKEALEKKSDYDELAKKVKEAVPEMEAETRSLPKDKGELREYLKVLIMVYGLITGKGDEGKNSSLSNSISETKSNIEVIIEECINCTIMGDGSNQNIYKPDANESKTKPDTSLNRQQRRQKEREERKMNRRREII